MNSELFSALDALEKEKGISKDYMLEKLETALITAFKKAYPNSNISVLLDPDKKECKVYKVMTVVETVENPDTEISLEEAQQMNRRYTLNAEIKEEIKSKNFSRTIAQSAKQVIIQSVREAERVMMMREFENKKEEIITATVVETDPATGSVILNTGTREAAMIKSEQIPGEIYNDGDHIKVYVTETSKDNKGRLVTLSRAHSGLVKRLFELEVPEIADGIVIIKNITREAGSRTKMSVMSRDDAVDPVGACIGNRGARIANIVDELNGEKIDIVKFSEDPAEYIASALSPAVVKSITFENERVARVIVAADQLSLAIGKEGQNARLANRLTGFKIDIKPE